MTRSRMMVALVSAMVVVMTGCADRIAAPRDADAERGLLVQRARALQASVLEAGSMSRVHERALQTLKADVTAWQARSGRTDLAFMESRPLTTEQVAASVSAQQRGTPSAPCVCVPVVIMGDLICFIEAAPNCTAGSRGGCKYACMVIS